MSCHLYFTALLSNLISEINNQTSFLQANLKEAYNYTYEAEHLVIMSYLILSAADFFSKLQTKVEEQ